MHFGHQIREILCTVVTPKQRAMDRGGKGSRVIPIFRKTYAASILEFDS